MEAAPGSRCCGARARKAKWRSPKKFLSLLGCQANLMNAPVLWVMVSLNFIHSFSSGFYYKKEPTATLCCTAVGIWQTKNHVLAVIEQSYWAGVQGLLGDLKQTFLRSFFGKFYSPLFWVSQGTFVWGPSGPPVRPPWAPLGGPLQGYNFYPGGPLQIKENTWKFASIWSKDSAKAHTNSTVV